FDGGTLSAREKMAREALVEAQASYRSTVITAFQNVADTLHAIEQDAGSLQGAARTEAAMKDALEITEKQYRYGLVNYQALLAARQNYQAALINLTQARVLRLGDTAALYMALGGGWWNRHGSS
ncbi:MAG: TolC family protein, partial [Burkholderiales bacterium]|nr:TolC family protein [Burkholderiales bacterium]